MTLTGKVLRILHLEDDPLDRELVEAQLRQHGLEVDMVWADDRGRYLAALQTSIDIILSDFALPNYDGMSALASAVELTPTTPFLFVSGAIGEERAIHALRQGALDYVLKTHLERLGPAVERAIREVEERKRRAEAETERDRLLVLEREARKNAELANRMKDDFLAVVSHELRTPLNAILGWTKILREGTPDQAMTRRALSTIERNAVAQARLIDDVLDVSRIVTGKLRIDAREMDLRNVIDAAAESAKLATASKSISLEVVVGDGVGSIYGDPERLLQVINNLVTNAIKFTPTGGRVTLEVTQAGEDVVLRVTDTGIGMDEEALPRVFERFFQVDSNSHTRSHRGLGLGLAIAKSLVEMHGGTIQAESAGVGRGSTFSFRIPCVASRRQVSAIPSSSPPAGSATCGALVGIRVLVVDDEEDCLELVRILLEKSGAVVRTAASADLALQAHRVFMPDVLVCDIGMPLVDGYSLLAQVRMQQTGESVPAIALTAFARDEDRRTAIAAGFDRHLTKPVNPDQLLWAIADLAAHSPHARTRKEAS